MPGRAERGMPWLGWRRTLCEVLLLISVMSICFSIAVFYVVAISQLQTCTNCNLEYILFILSVAVLAAFMLAILLKRIRKAHNVGMTGLVGLSAIATTIGMSALTKGSPWYIFLYSGACASLAFINRGQ
eukprot:evm.model.scf_3627.1 EVM.evm.TU.scf_3627.1   scf_3627:2917-5663(+)